MRISFRLKLLIILSAIGIGLFGLARNADANASTTTSTLTSGPATTTGSVGPEIQNSLSIFGDNAGLGNADPRVIIARLIRVFVEFMGVVLLLMVLSGGASYLFSGGDEERAAEGKKTLINAFVGLFIMLSAYSIVAFVLNALNSAGTAAP